METSTVISCSNVDNERTTIVKKKEKLNLTLFSAGKIVSLLGTYIYSFAISLYVLKVTGSGMSFAFSILVGMLPQVLLSPIAGSVADRIDRKKMVVGLDFLSGIVVLALLALSMLYGLKLSFIYATSFILAVISTFFGTSFSAAIPTLVTDKNLVKINSYNRAIHSSTSILGPVLGGVIFGIVSINLFLLINGISFILSAISEMFIDFKLNKQEEDKSIEGQSINIHTILKDIKEVLVYIKGNKLLCVIMPFSMTFNFLVGASFAVILPYIVNTVLGMSPYQYGIIDASASVGMFLAAIIIGKLPEKEKKLKGLFIGIIGMGITTIIMGIPGMDFAKGINLQIILAIYTVMLFIFAFFLVMIDMPLAVVMQRTIPNNMMGRVTGVLGTIGGALMPLGIILAGITLDIIPAYLMFFITGVYFVIAAFVMYKSKAMKDY